MVAVLATVSASQGTGQGEGIPAMMMDAVLHVYTLPDVCMFAHCYVTQHLWAVAWVWTT